MSIVIYLYNTFSLEFQLLIDRFTNSEGGVSTHTRAEQVLAGLNVIEHNLSLLIFGVGTGATSDVNWFSQYILINSLNEVMRIHNTFMSLLVENGFAGLSVYILLHLTILKKIIKSKNQYQYSLIGYLIGAVLYSQFAYILYFFPYWLSLIMLSLHADRLKVLKNVK
jgi:hypothetical protein